MGEIVLVRHGQANSAAESEEDYDRLSPLGHQQACWLGDWFRAQEESFDEVFSGTLRRQVDTATAMGIEARRDPRLNELDYFNLSRAFAQRAGSESTAIEDFAIRMPQIMAAWHRAEILGTETFEDFENRVIGVLHKAAMPGRRVLCITSGGVIGMIVRHLLKLDPERMAHILLPIMNTSIHRIRVMPHGTILAGFNATPHLDTAERAFARTHY
jgi:broad specificity phosphatase PhoE